MRFVPHSHRKFADMCWLLLLWRSGCHFVKLAAYDIGSVKEPLILIVNVIICCSDLLSYFMIKHQIFRPSMTSDECLLQERIEQSQIFLLQQIFEYILNNVHSKREFCTTSWIHNTFRRIIPTCANNNSRNLASSNLLLVHTSVEMGIQCTNFGYVDSAPKLIGDHKWIYTKDLDIISSRCVTNIFTD